MSTKYKNMCKGVRINIRLTKLLRTQYHKFCLENNTTISERVRDLIESDLKNGQDKKTIN